MSPLELCLLNDFQRGFPLVSRPFEAIGRQIGVDEERVIGALQRLWSAGAISRVGAVFSPGRVGASTLAAMAVPQPQLAAVADLVSSRPEVNHNYEREHRFNLWFVATAASEARLAEALDEIETQCGLPVMRLPLLEEYHIDLGFDLRGRDECQDLRQRGLAEGLAAEPPGRNPPATQDPRRLPASSRIPPAHASLVAALQEGLPLVPQPYARIASRIGISERAVIERLEHWLMSGVIKRLGVIVRHRELGYTANAMVVWDVPDLAAGAVGRRIASMDFVTLCYRRPRVLPHWPYNLFCMIHGREREQVLSQVQWLRTSCALEPYPYAVLFSRQAFKQRGAHYVAEAAHG